MTTQRPSNPIQLPGPFIDYLIKNGKQAIVDGLHADLEVFREEQLKASIARQQKQLADMQAKKEPLP